MSDLCNEKDCKKCLDHFKADLFWSCPYGNKRVKVGGIPKEVSLPKEPSVRNGERL